MSRPRISKYYIQSIVKDLNITFKYLKFANSKTRNRVHTPEICTGNSVGNLSSGSQQALSSLKTLREFVLLEHRKPSVYIVTTALELMY